MVKLLFPQPVTTFHFPPSFPGTPTEDTWPGITSNEEFRAYNFTQYRAQPLINHAPRYPPSPQHRSGGIGQPGTAPKWEPGALGSSAGCDAVWGRSQFSAHLCLLLMIATAPRCDSAPVCISFFSQVGLGWH